MKPIWLLCFHNYHTFGDYLILCFAILVIVHLKDVMVMTMKQSSLGGIEPQPQRVQPTTTRESCIPQQLQSPPNFQLANPNIKTI
jgi:hypothetical protein